jgi:hypothetical protein
MSFYKHISFSFSRIFKRFLLLFIFSLFLLVFIQEIRPFREVKPLNGAFSTNPYSPFAIDPWFNGDYQKTTESFLNDDFGFRNFLVRLNNQLRFSFFKQTNAKGVIIGKNNYLYEYGYVLAYNGKDFMGEKALQDSVIKIKQLQDALKNIGKQLLIVLAPSKVRVYPENILDSLNTDPGHYTNYMFYKKYLDEAGVNYIDFNTIFEKKKNESKYLLFPQLGIHWSRLEAVRAFDTIVKKLGSLSGNALPEVHITSINEKAELEGPDDDAVKSMNLLRYPKYVNMAYPDFEVITQNKDQKNLMVVADSYWWDIFLRKLPHQVFSHHEFRYYNSEIWGSHFFGKLLGDTLDTKRHILQYDYIIVMATESNYSRLGYGFFGQALAALKRTITPTDKEIKEIKKHILDTKPWHDQIVEKAKARKISLEEMIDLDAHWYFDTRGPVIKDLTLEDYKNLVCSTETWIEEVKRKAQDSKISVDSAVTIDALWAMNRDLSITNKKVTPSLEKVKEDIRHNYEWMTQIREKAKKRGITVDSMINVDAIWFINEQKAKN